MNGNIKTMPSVPFPRAVIFDMDGTLVATTEADYKAWECIFNDHGRPLSFEDYYPLLGKKSHDVVNDVLGIKDERSVEVLSRKMKYFEEIVEEKGIEVLPFAFDFLRLLKDHNILLGLATSSRQAKMKLVLEQSGLAPFFDIRVTGEMVDKGKPNPDIFLLTAEQLGISPDQCIVVEDAIHGVSAALAAGMKCIAIVSTHTREEINHAHLVIDSYAELTKETLMNL